MKIFIRLAVAIAAAGGAVLPAQGRVQPQMFCWSPDVEFPVACEEEEDEDEGNNRALLVTRPARHGLVPDTVPSLIEDQR
jgi:hypothetical protein